MPSPQTRPSHPRRAHALAGFTALLALAAPGSAQALGGSNASSVPATTTVPASARTAPATGGTAIAPASTTTATTATTAVPGTTPPATTVVPPTATTPGAATTTAPGTSATTPPAATTPAAHAPARASRGGGGLSTPAIALAALAALLALACLLWGVARARAVEPRWAQSLRHSLAEGGFRASATWAELADWARLGR